MNAPTKHKHADLILEHARQKATGELDAGWWKWECGNGDADEWWGLPPCASFPDWTGNCYRYTMTDKHPAFVKPAPKLRLVDFSKLPRDAKLYHAAAGATYNMLGLNHNGALKLLNEHCESVQLVAADYPWLRIAPSGWIGNPEGLDACPVPEGLRYEVMTRSGGIETGFDNKEHWQHRLREVGFGDWQEIIFYRILGLAEGWTDEPEAA